MLCVKQSSKSLRQLEQPYTTHIDVHHYLVIHLMGNLI